MRYNVVIYTADQELITDKWVPTHDKALKALGDARRTETVVAGGKHRKPMEVARGLVVDFSTKPPKVVLELKNGQITGYNEVVNTC